MKNHIAFKFTAVVLAALMLMTAIASGFGIALLSSYDLYNRTVDQGYEETLRDIRDNFAQSLIFRYASVELGGCSTPLIDDYYGNGATYQSFRWGRYAYSIRDKSGEVVVKLDRELPNAEHYEIPVSSGRFIYLIDEKNVEETTAARLPVMETTAPMEPETTAEPETEATEGTITPVADETQAPAASEEAPAEGEEAPAEGEEAPAEGEEAPAEGEEAPAEGEEAPAEGEEAAAEGEEAPAEGEETPAEGEETPTEGEEAAEETTAPSEEPAASEEPTVPETTAQPEADGEDGGPRYRANPYFTRDQFEEAFSYPYYNYESGAMKDATLCYASTSDFTVDLYLAEDALYDYQMWNLLEIIAPLRGELFIIMGVSILLFAILLAYLFCAAAKKPGSTEIEAVGFNRLPLDLYCGIAGMGLLGCLWLTTAGEKLFQNTQMLQLAVACGVVFLASLVIICYLLAWAAQIKMKNGFWWRNTLIARILGIVITAVLWLGKHLWSGSRKLPAALCRAGRFLRKYLDRFLNLMPAMWQWLLCTGVVMLVVLLGAVTHLVWLSVVGIVLAIGLTVYGGYCFATLLQGVHRMRAGELKTKVESRVLVGSMQEFADELNGLAGVAVVAAEKQLKSERMKTELITNVSHDIKTPLTSIINYVDLMERPHSQEEEQAYLDVLSRQSQRLKKLIDDLMDMSKASTGNMQTEITEVNAAEAVNQCLGEFADKLDKAMLIPVFHGGDRDVIMMADGRLVWRVMSNLLGNAVKYALPGTRVYVDLQELADEVIISVKNVSREELNISTEELMERFVRGDVSRNTEGSGLGLNIAKSLMELQHGELQLLVDGDLFKVTLVFPKKS